MDIHVHVMYMLHTESLYTSFFHLQVSSRLELLSFSHCRLDMHSLSGLLQHCQYVQELRLAAVGLTVDSLHPLTRYVAV